MGQGEFAITWVLDIYSENFIYQNLSLASCRAPLALFEVNRNWRYLRNAGAYALLVSITWVQGHLKKKWFIWKLEHQEIFIQIHFTFQACHLSFSLVGGKWPLHYSSNHRIIKVRKTSKIIWSNCHPMPVTTLDRVTQCNIYPSLEHLQGWRIYHLPGQPVPMHHQTARQSTQVLGKEPCFCFLAVSVPLRASGQWDQAQTLVAAPAVLPCYK